MPIYYTYDSDKNIVYTWATGDIHTAELKEYFEKILSDEKIAKKFWEVVNIEHASNVRLDLQDCKALLPLVKKFISEKEYQGALLFTPNNLPYFAAKLFFSVLNTALPATFLIERNKKHYQDLVHKYLGIQYNFNHE